MTDRDTLSAVGEELGAVFRPLTIALADPDAMTVLAGRLGWHLETMPPALASLGGPVSTIIDLLDTGEIDVGSLPRLLDAIKALLGAIDAIATQSGALPSTVDAAAFAAEFPRQLVDYLVVEYLLDYRPIWGALLHLLGVIRLADVPPSGKRIKFIRRTIAWEDLSRALDDPTPVFTNAFNWGRSDFRGEYFLRRVVSLLKAIGLRPRLDEPATNLEALLNHSAIAVGPDQDWVVRFPILDGAPTAAALDAGVGMFLLPETPADKPGFAILPYARGFLDERIQLTEELALGFEGAFNAAGGAAIMVRPGKVPQLVIDILSDGIGKAAGELAVGLFASGPGEPMVLIGSRDGSRFEIGGASIRGGGRADSSGKADAFIEFTLRDAKIVVKPGGDADGFVASLLPGDGFAVDASVLVGLSTSQGFYFGGSGALEIALPAHLALGPIEIVSALLAIKPNDGKIPVDLAATVRGDLGPLKAVVENVGLRAVFSFPAERNGNLGPVDIGLGFRPPNGVGLQIDAGVVKGGGYLFFEPDAGEYAGALELTFSGFLSLKAIGLITTRMPDGSAGFSLLVIITAEFLPGLQLGFGFTLAGVGGLLGLDRSVLLDPLAAGVRTGAINGILFPEDPVANAPRIISDLRAIFPPQKDRFLIGPMAKLGWGTPTLVRLSLGVIIEIPGNVAILGVLKVALPVEDAPLIVLQVSFVGAIEFDRSRGWFFAALYESRILFIPLEGEMGMLIAVGADANFVLSVGGFHPGFTAPPLPFPVPRRLSFDILNTPAERIRVEAYFAVTTNTVQFGARAELFFGFSSLSVEGHLGFDALIRFSPLYFIVQVDAGASLKAFGVGVFSISLDFTLEGPTPWRARGRGSVSLLFIEISADFDVTWGDPFGLILSALAIIPLLVEELERSANWRALLPTSSNLLVSLRKLDLPPEVLVLHPLGTLEVSQNAIPLQVPIDKVGAQKPQDANLFALSIKSSGLVQRREARRAFAPAQFREMKDAEKLTARSFENEVSGIELGVDGAELRTGRGVKRVVRYEVTTIDTAFRRFRSSFFVLAAALFNHFLKGNAVSKSVLSQNRKKQLQPFADSLELGVDRFAVAFTQDNRAHDAATADFATEGAARAWLIIAQADDPTLADSLHIIPTSELAAA
jgi:hypothetical protein